MLNQDLIKAGRDLLKHKLSMCNEKEQFMFKHMYSFKNIHIDINAAVDAMANNYIDRALTQVDRTLELKEKANE